MHRKILPYPWASNAQDRLLHLPDMHLQTATNSPRLPSQRANKIGLHHFDLRPFPCQAPGRKGCGMESITGTPVTHPLVLDQDCQRLQWHNPFSTWATLMFACLQFLAVRCLNECPGPMCFVYLVRKKQAKASYDFSLQKILFRWLRHDPKPRDVDISHLARVSQWFPLTLIIKPSERPLIALCQKLSIAPSPFSLSQLSTW